MEERNALIVEARELEILMQPIADAAGVTRQRVEQILARANARA